METECDVVEVEAESASNTLGRYKISELMDDFKVNQHFKDVKISIMSTIK